MRFADAGCIACAVVFKWPDDGELVVIHATLLPGYDAPLPILIDKLTAATCSIAVQTNMHASTVKSASVYVQTVIRRQLKAHCT